ncbi:hypothetical protein D3P96_01860 [Weissella viridescens]|uniref:Uncharacterized protein n=1 Tax=Weissella viridescens TaxID=1629 RepID=A0A3P2RDM2_WEIVI|nr:hypothetical protein [Weissella viridescens]RRG18753.1 hypothetical protein D3P96_01860 [Weissella viridescens]
MGVFGTTMVCIAEWLLFVFPLYQAYLELDEQRDLLLSSIDFNEIRNHDFDNRKIHLRDLNQLKTLLTDEQKAALKAFNSLRNKAVAWFFVALAGYIKACSSTYEVMEHFSHHVNTRVFILVIVILTGLGLAFILSRVLTNEKVKAI